MKNLFVISFAALCCLVSGCLYEPPPVNYTFSIKNNSDHLLRIEKQTKDENYKHVDSIAIGGEYKTEFTELHCYKDFYKDTLIATFFKELKIGSEQKDIKTDLFKRTNWKESILLKKGNCKGGNVNYLLEINNKDL